MSCEIRYERVALGVEAVFSSDGKINPTAVICDSRRFPIDRVVSVRRRCPRTVGCVAPLEYTVDIGGTVRLIYYEYDSNSWFSVRERI